MPGADQSHRRTAVLLLIGLASLKVAVHLWNHPAYGYFRDELYYLACADHLAWGYVDHPPLSIFILAAVRGLFGNSMFAIRLPAILAGAATVFLTGVLTRQLGGGRFAQALAALACLAMPIALGLGTFFSMNAFDMLFWLAGVLVVVRLIDAGAPRDWLLFGVIAGLGMMNKISMGFLVFGLGVGLLLTPERQRLRGKWLWIGGGIALLLFLPHVLWQVANGFPTREFVHNASSMKMRAMASLEYLAAQVLYTNPITVPIWLAGLGYFLFARHGRAYRSLGIAYIAILVLLIAQQGKAYYLAPAYPMLLAGGGVAIERFTDRRARWLRPVSLLAVTVIGAALAPLAMPILSPEATFHYVQTLGIDAPQEERNARRALSQHLADRFGWDNMVATIARVHRALPPAERARAAIFAGNYGEAGAVNLFGPSQGLPPAISGHNNFWLWGPGEATGEVTIVVGLPAEALQRLCEEVEQAETVESPWAMPYETDLPVYVCRRLKRPLPEVWSELKRYI